MHFEQEMSASSSVDRVAAGRSDVLATSFGNQRLEDQIGRARQDDNVNPVDRIWSEDHRSRDEKIPLYQIAIYLCFKSVCHHQGNNPQHKYISLIYTEMITRILTLFGDELHSARDAFQPKFICGFRQVALERFYENQPCLKKKEIVTLSIYVLRTFAVLQNGKRVR